MGKTSEEKRRLNAKRGYVRVAGSTLDLVKDPSQIEDWDDEELERGQRKDKNGRFTGSPPKVVPAELHRELTRRRLRRAQELMSSALEPALAELRAIIDSPVSEDKDKLTAIKLILDRVLGKSPERVEIAAEAPKWLQALQSGIVAVDGEDDEEGDDIIDADVVWDSDEEAS